MSHLPRLAPFLHRLALPRLALPRLALTAVTGLAVLAPAPALQPGSAQPVATQSAQLGPSYEEFPLRPSSGVLRQSPGALRQGLGTAYASAAVSRTKPFSLVGVTWPNRADSQHVDVKVRVQRNGRWSAWERLPVEDDHAPDPSAPEGVERSGTEPYWVGDANGVQVSLTTTDGTTIRDAKVALIQPGTLATDAEPPVTAQAVPSTAAQAVPLAVSAAPYAMPPIVTRRGWGADERLRAYNGAACAKPKYTSTVQAAFVHHTVDRNDYTRTQVPAMVRGMYAYHVKSRGWCDLGYNFLVDRFGRAFEGRYGGMHLPVLGAHTGGYNANSFGISMIGNYETAVPSTAAREMTARIIAWKMDANYRSPRTTLVLAGTKLLSISGHRDTTATACPGKNLYAALPWLRQRTHILMGKSVATEIYRFALRLGGFPVVGQPVWGEHATRTGRATYFGVRDIHWSVAAGPHSVMGSFRTLYRKLGDSRLGLPTTELYSVPGGKRQNFQGGSMVWRTADRKVYVQYKALS